MKRVYYYIGISIFLLFLSLQHSQARIVEVASYPQIFSACRNAIPNDTIIIAPGVYTINDRAWMDIDGRPGPVLVKGATGNPEDVVIRGLGVDNLDMIINFNLNNCPNWTFEALTVRDSYYHGFKFDLGSTDCTLRNVIMLDHGESGVKGTSNPAVGIYPDRLLIENCLIGFTIPTGGNRPNVEGVDGVGVNDWIIRSTTFINVQRNGQPAYACFTKGNSSNTIIENCLFVNCLVGASFGGGESSDDIYRDNNREFEHRNGIIRNNVFIRCTDAAVYINKADNCKIYNNTVFECEYTIQLLFPQTSGYVYNNLVLRSPNNPYEEIVRSRFSEVFTAKENNLAATYEDFVRSKGSNEEINLHFAETSAAIDAGVDVGTDVEYDYRWNNRPAGNAIDVGAYEFGAISSVKLLNRLIDKGIVKTYPNPARNDITFDFSIPAKVPVRLSIFNIAGDEVDVLSEGTFESGTYTMKWNSSDFSPGTYIYNLQAGKITKTGKIVVLR